MVQGGPKVEEKNSPELSKAIKLLFHSYRTEK